MTSLLKKILIRTVGFERFEIIKAFSQIPDLVCNTFYDFNCFVRSRLNTREIIRARITMDYHRIEKGLALRQPRLGFGEDVVQRLIDNIYKYKSTAGVDTLVSISLKTLNAYAEFHISNGHSSDLILKIAELNKSCQSNLNISEADSVNSRWTTGGYKWVSREEIHHQAVIDLEAFFQSRYSIRDFSEKEVDLEIVKKALRMASKTPSVCNRQAWRVYLFDQKCDILSILALQNGNRGFREQVPLVAIVTCERSAFVNPAERNQAWIDGGMFCMSFVYALHSLGLGSCCLNWSVGRSLDIKLKKLTGIPKTDAVIMMIAIGHLPDRFKVACSARNEVHTFLRINSLS